MVPDAHIVSVICSFALVFFFFILAACGHCHSFPLDILWTDYVLNIKKRDFDLCQQTRKRGKKRTDWRNILPRPAIKFTSFHPLSLILFHPCFPWKMCVEFGKTHGREGRGRWESDSEDHLFLPSSDISPFLLFYYHFLLFFLLSHLSAPHATSREAKGAPALLPECVLVHSRWDKMSSLLTYFPSRSLAL